MYADGETPHPQRQKILKISGNAVTSAIRGQFEDIGTVTNAIKNEQTSGRTIQRNVQASYKQKLADRAVRPAALRLGDDEGEGAEGDTLRVATLADAVNGIKVIFLNDDVTNDENARTPTRSKGFKKCRDKLISLSEGTITEDHIVQWETQLQVVDVLLGCCGKGNKIYNGVKVRNARDEDYAAGVARQFDALHRLARDTPEGITITIAITITITTTITITPTLTLIGGQKCAQNQRASS